MKKLEDLQTYLKFELTQYSLSLFDETLILKHLLIKLTLFMLPMLFRLMLLHRIVLRVNEKFSTISIRYTEL